MEQFRSSGTSGGLIYSRTRTAYMKARASEFLRAVEVAETFAIANGALREKVVKRTPAEMRNAILFVHSTPIEENP